MINHFVTAPFCLPSFIPFFYPAYASSWRRSMRPLMVLRL